MAGLLAEQLLERDLETADLQRAVDHSAHGVGRLVVIQGPAGIGKTTLIADARERARSAGMNVRFARGAELETGFTFGIVRQLLDPLVAAAGADERARWFSGAAELAAPLFEAQSVGVERDAGDSIYPRLHGLYWTCSNIARTRPMGLFLDDAQWADEPSLEFFGFLARRLDELPVLLVVGARSPDRGASAVLAAVTHDPSAQVVKPRGLTADGVEQVLSAQTDGRVQSRFARACHDATAGNPFLVGELMRELGEAKIEPIDANAARVGSLGSQRLADAVLDRLGRVSPVAPALARAVAILGDGAGIATAAALANVGLREASDAAGAMLAHDLLGHESGLSFAHPIIRSAIYRSMVPAERELRHAEAAELLYRAEAPAEHVAAQILLAGRFDQPWLVEQLRRAAGSALTLGAPQNAVAYLRRALSAAHEPADRSALLAQLGHAEVLAGHADATGHLEQAIETAPDPNDRARTAIMLSQVLKFTGGGRRAVELLSEIGAVTDPELGERIEIERLSTALASRAAHELLAERINELHDNGRAAATERERFELVVLAYEWVLRNRPVVEIRDLIARAEPRIQPPDERIVMRPGVIGAGAALIYCDGLDEAGVWFAGLVEHGRRRGSLTTLAIGLSLLAEVDHRRGDLVDALARATESLELGRSISAATRFLFQYSMATINNVAVERNLPNSEIARLVRETDENLDEDAVHVSVLLHSRARLLYALGDARQALAQLLELGAQPEMPGVATPAFIPWRSSAALISYQLGDRATALRLADDELTLARSMGAPRAVGIALRALALVQPEPSVELLEEAVGVLAQSPARLERARALVDLGAALRRSGERSAARVPLRDGHDLAVLCGATRLTERAHQEIAATGARVAPVGLRGIASLTPSERRVAELAAHGHTNRDIAQILFVTEKTIETHLRHVFDKLDVRSRHKLAAMLAETDAQPVGGPQPSDVAAGGARQHWSARQSAT